MKTFIFISLISFAILFGCKKEKEADSITCNLEAAPSEFEEESIAVTYTLQTSGDFTVTSFYYYDESGRVDLNNPSTPQEITVVLTDQKTLQTGAQGSVKDGFIEVEYNAVSSGSQYTGSSRCEQYSQ